MKKNIIISITYIMLVFINTISAYSNEKPFYNADTTGLHNKIVALLNENSSNFDSLKKALNISEQADNYHLIGMARSFLADYYIVNNNYDKAEENLKIASSIYSNINDSSKLAAILNEKAVIGYYRGNYNEAIEFLKQAIEIYAETNDKKGLQRSLMISGAVYLRKSDYVNALTDMEKSLAYAIELKDSGSVAQVNNNMGIIYKQLGDYNKALSCYSENLRYAEMVGDLNGLSDSYNNIGAIFEALEDYDEALAYYKKSYLIDQEINNQSDLAIVCINISNIYSHKNNSDSALFYAKKSIDINQKIGFRFSVGEASGTISSIYIKEKDFVNALKYNDEAFKLMQDVGSKREVCLCYIRYGEIYLGLKNYKEAEKNLLIAMQISDSINNKEDRLNTMELLSTTYFMMNDSKKAYSYQKRYIELNKELFAEEKTQYILEMQTRFDVATKEKEIENLRKSQEVKELELEKSKAEIRIQKIIRNFSFIAFASLILIALLIFNRYKINQNRARLEFEKHHAETENRLLRSQMNPHFIFNSLYSIQGFVASNDAKMAQSYIVDFASLMRAILNNSRQSFITLENEIETLRLYMKLEQMRFAEKFDFKIEVDEDIEKEFVLVPPMLIQPFVENSIIHGLFPKEGSGNLSVVINEQNNSLLCSIIDDGIGREESYKQKEIKIEMHKSVGMEVTKNRLELIGEELKVNTYMKISDLKDEDSKPSGTRVDIVIPTKEA